MIANKGGIGISFKFGKTSFAFINCHLACRFFFVFKRKRVWSRTKQEKNLEKKQGFLLFTEDLQCLETNRHFQWIGVGVRLFWPLFLDGGFQLSHKSPNDWVLISCEKSTNRSFFLSFYFMKILYLETHKIWSIFAWKT